MFVAYSRVCLGSAFVGFVCLFLPLLYACDLCCMSFFQSALFMNVFVPCVVVCMIVNCLNVSWFLIKDLFKGQRMPLNAFERPL